MKKTLKNFKLDKETIEMLEELVGDYGKNQTAVVINLIHKTHRQAKRKPRKENKK